MAGLLEETRELFPHHPGSEIMWKLLRNELHPSVSYSWRVRPQMRLLEKTRKHSSTAHWVSAPNCLLYHVIIWNTDRTRRAFTPYSASLYHALIVQHK